LRKNAESLPSLLCAARDRNNAGMSTDEIQESVEEKHYHARSGKPLHSSDFSPHLWLIPMYCAFPAHGFLFPVSALTHIQKLMTLSTKAFLMVLFTAIEKYHEVYSLKLAALIVHIAVHCLFIFILL
jgi:hypothetical protein